MKKGIAMLLVCAAAGMTLLGGCSKDNGAAGSSTAEAEGETIKAKTLLKATDYDVKDYVTLMDDYMNLSVELDSDYAVTEEAVNDYIQNSVLPYYPVYTKGDKTTVESGDVVNIDYTGTLNGEAFDGGSDTGYNLEIGSGQFIDGFEDGLVGHKKGEEVSLDLTFPEDYFNEDLAGAEVVFDVTINDVKRVPELTDGLAAEIDPNSTTAEEYVENVRAMLQENEDFTEHQNLSYLAISAVVEDSEVEPSEEAVEWKISDLIVNYYEPMLNQSYGFGLAEMLSMQAVTLEEFRDQLREAATQEVSQLLVADEIAKEQNLTVGEQELEDFAARYHMTLQDMLTNYSQEELDALVKEQLAMDYIVEHAEITYADEEETAEEETLAEETAEAE